MGSSLPREINIFSFFHFLKPFSRVFEAKCDGKKKHLFYNGIVEISLSIDGEILGPV